MTSTRLWCPAVLVRTRVWLGCSVSRAHKTWSRSLLLEGFLLVTPQPAGTLAILSGWHDIPQIENIDTVISLRGTREGAVVRELASHQCGPGSNPSVDSICGLSLLSVLSFVSRGFSPATPVFPFPQKPAFTNSTSTKNQVDEESLCGCATSKSLFIYYYLFI